MDKETLSNYGWIVILVLILAVMIALATPFGSFIAGAVKSTTAGFFSVNQNAMGAAGITIPGSSFEDTEGGEEGGATPVAGTPALYAEDGSVIKTWEELIDEGKVFVEGTTLTRVNITEGYRLVVPSTIKTYAAKTYYDQIWNSETFKWEDVPAAFGFKVLEFQIGLETVTCDMYGCGDIEKIIFPDTVTFFGRCSFDNCYFVLEFKGNTYDLSSWNSETMLAFNMLPECEIDINSRCDCEWYTNNGWTKDHNECIESAYWNDGVIHYT